ncbi:MAG: aminopeptidase [Gammaproteobacteria bacterium]|nr:aminopeptidase [Gammaproteobacteria bacterium]
MRWRQFAVALVALATGGCASLGYYAGAVGGQLELMREARPVAELLADPAVEPALARRLRLAGDIVAFAERELALPADGSYTRYAALGRRFVAWNVFAAPEFALEPRRWCYPLVGCLAYRGYFDPDAAAREADRLRDRGEDVHVAGVVAYSTLGWFDDPLLDTFLFRREDRLAWLLFHELAHRRFFLAGDTAFNESYATAVADEGVRRWLRARGDELLLARAARDAARRGAVVELLLGLRGDLAGLYAGDHPAATLRARKAARIARALGDYAALRARWDEDVGFDAWMEAGLNNAKLNTVGLYHRLVPGFLALLVREGGAFAPFHAEVERLAAQPEATRHARLAEYASLWDGGGRRGTGR